MPEPNTILVTGGCGYLGSSLIRALPDAFPGATVRILDNLQRETHRALLGLPAGARYSFLEGDILDGASVRRALEGVDAVVHLAALVRTPMSFENPTWMEQVNHWGTARLLEACLEAGVERFVYPSSAAVYGPGGPFAEDEPCHPVGPYANSKLQAERAVVAAGERGLTVNVLRLGMLYGLAPAMRFEGVVNRLLFLAGTGRAMTVYGDGRQRRPVVHVDDASRAVLRALGGALEASPLNVAAANPSVLELVDGIRGIEPAVDVRDTDQDVLTHLSFEIDCGRARASGWTPEVDHAQAMAAVLGAILAPVRDSVGSDATGA